MKHVLADNEIMGLLVELLEILVDSEESQEHTNTLETLHYKLNQYPIEQVMRLWKQLLDLAYKEELNDNLNLQVKGISFDDRNPIDAIPLSMRPGYRLEDYE